MNLIIHRGTQEIGGSCVEISHGSTTILVDLGLPLDTDVDEELESHLPQPLFSNLRNGGKSIDGVLISHPHIDHYGLAGMLPEEIPVYSGKASWELMNATVCFSPNKIPLPGMKHFKSEQTFQIGELTITPYLMDHSAFDAYGFLVSGGGKNVFYSGDFRGHGRKASLLDRLPESLPKIDALIMEGTLIGNRISERHVSESELENDFVTAIKKTHGIALVTTSSQNIDRLVTIFKAAKRSDRVLIIDFYTAEILEILKDYAKLPNAAWSQIRVCYPQYLARFYEEQGLNDILVRHRVNGIKWSRINEMRKDIVMLLRPGFMADIRRFINLDDASWIYSMWPGYFDRSPSLQKLRAFLQERGVDYQYLHTSGHARLTDMKNFVEKLKPKTIIPVHSFHADQFPDHFANVQVVKDGDLVNL